MLPSGAVWFLYKTLRDMSDRLLLPSVGEPGFWTLGLCCLTCPLFPCLGIHVFFSINSYLSHAIRAPGRPGARPLSSRDRGLEVGAVKPKGPQGSCSMAAASLPTPPGRLPYSYAPSLHLHTTPWGWTRSVLPMSLRSQVWLLPSTLWPSGARKESAGAGCRLHLGVMAEGI